MGELRKIPITLKNDHEKVIGYMMLDDTVSDEELIDSSVSWAYFPSTKQIMEATFIPHPKAVPMTIEIENVKKIVGSATVAEDGTVTANVTDPAFWDKIKDKGPYSLGD